MAIVYTQSEIDTHIQDINCLVACMGKKMSDAGKRGDNKSYDMYIKKIAIVEGVVDALVCYNPSVDTNFLTPEQIQRLISNGYGIGSN